MSAIDNASIYIGWDPNEQEAFQVCRSSIERHLSAHIPIHALVLGELRQRGLYLRPHEQRGITVMKDSNRERPIMWDVVSNAPMSTEFANTRFFVPHLAKTGLALFLDCDILVRDDLVPLFVNFPLSKAIGCVQHKPYTPAGKIKMDGQLQTNYRRKNWSSVMMFNCDHIANRALTLALCNALPGRLLHGFAWVDDVFLHEFDPAYNHLVGEHEHDPSAKVVHFTNGGPWLPEFADVPFADEWRSYLEGRPRAA